MPPRIPEATFCNLFARYPAAIAATVLITKPTIAMMTPFPVVSTFSSRTENRPKEESITVMKRKAKRAGTPMYTQSISWPPKKQVAIPAAIKIAATNQGLEFKY